MILPLIAMLFLGSCRDDATVINMRIDLERSRVEISMNEELFTVYRFDPTLEKPFLFPVNAPGEIAVTRGWPLETRPGERADHPHHTGFWLNYGDVNGFDFWNNSMNISRERKGQYGRIVHREILKTVVKGDTGILEVRMDWIAPDTDRPVTLLEEHTTYRFHGTGNARIIDRITLLKAVADTVVLGDNKEGLAAIRVAREFEHPEMRPVVLTDASGQPSDSAVIDNSGVTGHYLNSRGIEGGAVWGERAEWVKLTGCREGDTISIVLFDHPGNPNHPSVWHARGYGLFSVNNLGQKSYRDDLPALSHRLTRGETLILKHRLAILAGDPDEQEIGAVFGDFTEK
jgi:hypothetical protein